MDKLIEVVARAICRVQLNGGDPGQPAVRWNGTEIEPQSFPAWRDYLDEARHSLSAIEAAGIRMDWQPIETAPKDKQIQCGHSKHKWIRYGQFYSNVSRWYYSGTNERSQWAQVEGDEPTHWMPLPLPPQE